MERKSCWKNFVVLIVGGLLALHLDVASAAETDNSSTTSSDASDECVLEQE